MPVTTKSTYRAALYVGPVFLLTSLTSQAVHAQGFEVAANGLPILNSNPGALSVAYMDFDGGNALGGTYRGPYGGDLDFNATEQQQIYTAWLDVSAHFAMFDINVTTVAPNKSVNPTSHVIISPDVSGGAANVNFHGNTGAQARGQNSAGHATGRTTGITHEFGHVLGLSHQSEFDTNGDLVKQYRGVDEWNRAPLMGVDFAGGRYAHWADGPNINNSFFDEAQFIANKITSVNNNFVGGSYSGDGYRVDEHSNVFASATPLMIEQTGMSGDNLIVAGTSKGIIERYSDIDMFSLDWTGGQLSVSAEAVRSLASAQTYASSVGLNLRAYDSGGNQVAEDLAVNPADVNVALNLDLDAGTYFFAFEGAGGTGDLGAYEIEVDGVTTDPTLEPYQLIYRPSTGRVLINTQDGVVINYVIEGSGFVEQQHTRLFGGPFGSSLDDLLSETDGSIQGVGGILSLGTVIDRGLDETAYQSLLSRATYVAGLGEPTRDFELVYDVRQAIFYNTATGEVTIDTLDDTIMNYVLEGSGFIEENHTRILPLGLGTSQDDVLSESSLSPVSGVVSLGNILPSLLTPAQFEAMFTKFEYVAALGTAKQNFEFGFIHLPGDTDLDVDIDDSDLGTVFANYSGPGATGLSIYLGDTDGDGDIDDSDLGTIFASYTGPRSTAVPEPTSMALLGFGGLLLARRRQA